MSNGLKKKRVCIIGCGPAGMSTLYHFGKLPDDEIPEIVCYEKQSTWGGMWNVTWRTGEWIPSSEATAFEGICLTGSHKSCPLCKNSC